MKLPMLVVAALLAGDSAPVAIVASLEGEARLERGGGQAKTLKLFERLQGGSSIAVDERSRLVLVFGDGRRVEMGPGSRGTLAGPQLDRRSGPVRDLPPLPSVAPVLQPGVGDRVAAVRIRSVLVALYPRGGAATLADATVLRFAASRGDWRVELFDDSGTVVFGAPTESTEVHVPQGALKPGARYSWRVQAEDATGVVHKDEGSFVTLSSELAEVRARFKETSAGAGDVSLVALQAELDRSLGLLWEAREGFGAALRLSPSDPALRDGLRRVERDMGLGGEP